MYKVNGKMVRNLIEVRAITGAKDAQIKALFRNRVAHINGFAVINYANADEE